MPGLALTLIFVPLLAASWWFLFRLYLKSRKRESLSTKKFEDARKKLQEEIDEMDSVFNLLGGVHELGYEDAGTTKELLAKMIVDCACQITKLSSGSLMLIDKESNDLNCAASKGVPEEKKSAMRVKLGEGIAGRAAESGKTILVENVETDARFLRNKGVEADYKSVAAVPVKIKNRVIGVLNVYAQEQFHQFSQRDLRLLNILSAQSAITIENWDMHDNLQKFYLEMIETLARVLELKEHVNRGQAISERVRHFARQIAQELSLPDSIARHIEFAALIHGIGKMGIDDAILRKPGKLSPEEYEQIKKHPEIGKEMIARVKFLSPATSMILYHQERWDGKGYPAGLKGEEIPLGSRIVAVINAFQAMMTDRPYRKALTEMEAIEELKRGSGTQFDPKIVDAFVKVLKKGIQSEQTNRGETPSRVRDQQSESTRKWN